MKKKVVLLIILIIGLIENGNSQDKKSLQEINGLWLSFCQAFDSLDYELFSQIHSTKLIRIPNGKQIIDYDRYIEKYKVNFEKERKANSTVSISLRFIERINNDSIASERGIYKYVRNKNNPNEETYYGKFHVLLIKEKGDWKILMDYDSSEGGAINEEDYNQACDMDNIEKFIKK